MCLYTCGGGRGLEGGNDRRPLIARARREVRLRGRAGGIDHVFRCKLFPGVVVGLLLAEAVALAGRPGVAVAIRPCKAKYNSFPVVVVTLSELGTAQELVAEERRLSTQLRLLTSALGEDVNRYSMVDRMSMSAKRG